MFDPGSSILYMKVGTHAKEELADIIRRKQREIEQCGMAMWGYGGNTCHPASMVQPFANQVTARGERIVLAMQPMNSKHFADQIRAEEYSANGELWEPIPLSINVLGSRYALCIDSLSEVSDTLSLASTRVAIGNSKGKVGSSYVRGRVDKACLEVAESAEANDTVVKIGLVANVVAPYAVFLRN